MEEGGKGRKEQIMARRVDDWGREGGRKWVRQADGGGVVQQQLEEEDWSSVRRFPIYAAFTHTQRQNTFSISWC